jgi:integrative and conjugative element protein (TIGR02256 family)
VRPTHLFESADWRVVLDDGIIERLRALRAERAPKETGGIIVGYTDQVSRTIYVVDVHPAPGDSVEEAVGFVRGVDGLHAAWKEVQERTASIVNYIGEWHSHPPQHGASPSWDDMTLVAQLGEVLARDGEPALMVIIAEDQFSIFVSASDGTTTLITAAGA